MSDQAWEGLRQAVLADAALQTRLWKTRERAAFREQLTTLGAPAEGSWPWDSGPIRLPGYGAAPSPTLPVPEGWVPAQLDLSARGVLLEWRFTGGEPLSQPFYTQDMQRLAAHPLNAFLNVRTPLQALPPAENPPPPAGLIFHLSRCGSTLVSNMLAALPGVLAISEPQPVGAIARAGGDIAERAQVLRRMAAAIGRGLGGGTLILKLEARAILDLAVYRLAFPDTPWVFLHRDPAEVLASHQRLAGPEMVPGAVDWPQTDLQPASAEEYQAQLLGRICEAATEGLAEGGGLAIAYPDLPEAVWRIAERFGLRATAAERAVAETRAGQDAKRPGQPFDGAADRQRAEGDPAVRAVADRWARAAYEQMVETGRLAEQAAPRSAMAPILKLPMRFDAARLRSELAGVEATEWVSHFNRGYYEGDWSALPLRSPGGGTRRIDPSPARPEAFLDTAHMARFPYVQEILAAFPMPLRSVRLLKLAAGSSILEHTDEYLGFGDGQVRFHIPIVTDPLVEFRVADGRLDMAEGEAWYIDFNHPHSVTNRSRIDRVHLVIDGLVNAWVRDLFAELGG